MKSETLSVLEHDKYREREAVQRKNTSSAGEAGGTWLLNLPFAGKNGRMYVAANYDHNTISGRYWRFLGEFLCWSRKARPDT